MIDWIGTTFAFLLGTVVGSFLNVCIYRLPRGESIAYPGSHCPSCGTALRPRDLVPLLSFLVQGRKCRYCGAAISWRYFIVELLTGLYFAVLYVFKGPSLPLALLGKQDILPYAIQFGGLALFGAALIAVFFIDLDHMIIPDEISVFVILLGIARDVIGIFVPAPGEAAGSHLLRISIPLTRIEFPMLRSILGVLLFGTALWLVAELGTRAFRREAMGGGDIKLLAGIGANLAAGAVVIGFFVAVLVGSVIGILLRCGRKIGKWEEIPFGPMLVAGALFAVFLGTPLWNAYLKYAGLAGN